MYAKVASDKKRRNIDTVMVVMVIRLILSYLSMVHVSCVIRLTTEERFMGSRKTKRRT